MRSRAFLLALFAAASGCPARSRPLVEVAFTLPHPDLLTEGLAFDPGSGDFFVSSVHHRKVLRVSKDGAARDFIAEGQGGIGGVLGMAVDPARGSLWITTSGLPEAGQIAPDLKDRTALVELDLASGRQKSRIDLQDEAGKRHNLNDVIVARDGKIYASDSFGAVYVTIPGSEARLDVVVPASELKSPQGLALSSDGRWLFLLDYGKGLGRCDLADPKHALTWFRSKEPMNGLDGLYLDRDGTFIATQNGVSPPRVVRIRVNGDEASMTAIFTGDPRMEEPTLGAIVGDDFYFIANAQWDLFGPAAKDPKPKPPIIMRLDLRASR